MEQKNKQIEQLLEQFFEGTTSNAEEKELYNFFSQGNVPKEFIKYKPVLHYLECEIGHEIKFSEEDKAIVDIYDYEIKAKKTLLANKWVLAIAASIALLIGTKVYVDYATFNPYEGSYIIRNGVVITDRTIIEAEKEKLEKLMNEKITCLNQPRILAQQQIEMYEDLEEELQLQIEDIEAAFEITK